jgi:hypothetical protein
MAGITPAAAATGVADADGDTDGDRDGDEDGDGFSGRVMRMGQPLQHLVDGSRAVPWPVSWLTGDDSVRTSAFPGVE